MLEVGTIKGGLSFCTAKAYARSQMLTAAHPNPCFLFQLLSRPAGSEREAPHSQIGHRTINRKTQMVAIDDDEGVVRLPGACWVDVQLESGVLAALSSAHERFFVRHNSVLASAAIEYSLRGGGLATPLLGGPPPPAQRRAVCSLLCAAPALFQQWRQRL